MEKPASLRVALTKAFPDLRKNTDKLHMWIEGGEVMPVADSLSFTENYTLKIGFEEFSGDVHRIFTVINNWLQTNQPDIIRNKDKQPAYTFEAEAIDHNKSDVLVNLKLSEGVAVNPNDKGGYEMKIRPEPSRANIFAILHKSDEEDQP